jgi:hypothetical protein
MAVFALHLDLAETLYSDMERAHRAGEWPIAVDAGYYAVFHGMEAMSALDCRDSYTFADAADILENVLVQRGLGREFLDDYRYLFYFRRGAVRSAHSDVGAIDRVRRAGEEGISEGSRMPRAK